MRYLIAVSLATTLGLSAHAAERGSKTSLPAFPEAQGGGAASVGGRGGAQILVTNLNDSGPGSLRACIESSGPRTCIFRVAGIIELNSTLYVSNPYLTIAGQTAPGGGIAISGRNTCAHAMMIATHDVIVRYMRIRHGYHNNQCGGINLMTESNAYNVVIDHSSFAWGNGDDTAGLDASRDPASYRMTNQTWSWNVFAEPLSAHPTEIVLSCQNGCDAAADIDLHHNLLISASYRMPLVTIKAGRFVNNIVYNSGLYYSSINPGVTFDFIGNKYVAGPLQVFVWGSAKTIHEVQLPSTCAASADYCSSGTAALFMSGNIGPNQPSPSGNQWQMTALLSGAANSAEAETPIPNANQRSTPLGVTYPYPIKPDAATSLDGLLLPTVGASRRLGCDGAWVANRDSTDVRLVNEYDSHGGARSFPHSEDDVGGYPTIAGGSACAMTIPDGIPDEWKRAHGLAVGGPSRANEIASNGYTYLENYLNGGAGGGGGGPPGGGGGGGGSPPGSGSGDLPDVTVTALDYDNTSHLFTSVVKNVGAAPTPSNVVIGNGFYVDDEQVTWGNTAGPLPPGASVTIDSSGGGAYAIPEGTHKITVKANDYGCCGRFEEADKSNNSLSDEIVISPCPPARKVK